METPSNIAQINMNIAPIEIHRDELKSIGIDIIPFGNLSKAVQTPHRDDHYMFIIQTEGTFHWELDFTNIILSGSSAYYIAPGQVHRYIGQDNCTGWFVFMDPLLISEKYTKILNTWLNINQGVTITPENLIFSIIRVFESLIKQKKEFFQNQLEYSLADTVLGLFTGALVQQHGAEKLVGGQKYQTVYHFKHLLQSRYKEFKQAKDYAAFLNITPLYLNEIVKQITGFTVSYWIQQTIVLEAKRLLYYSKLDIKQVAFELGYEDHTYFSRFFKKNTGITATDFRLKNHDLSNSNLAMNNI